MKTKNRLELATVSRRGVALLGILGIGAMASGFVQSTKPKETRTSIHQEITFDASPAKVYEALLDSKKFAALTGMTATIHREEGGAFKTFNGIIEGRNIELVKDKRIVQAWRPNYWEKGMYSVVKMELVPKGARTKLILDHTGFPAEAYEGFDTGWPKRYWEPLKRFLAR